MFPRFVRESAFNLVRRDVAQFLAEHEDDLLRVFRAELQSVDDGIPEENLFIDLKIVPLGEVVVKAALRAVRRFLIEDFVPPSDGAV